MLVLLSRSGEMLVPRNRSIICVISSSDDLLLMFADYSATTRIANFLRRRSLIRFFLFSNALLPCSSTRLSMGLFICRTSLWLKSRSSCVTRMGSAKQAANTTLRRYRLRTIWLRSLLASSIAFFWKQYYEKGLSKFLKPYIKHLIQLFTL